MKDEICTKPEDLFANKIWSEHLIRKETDDNFTSFRKRKDLQKQQIEV